MTPPSPPRGQVLRSQLAELDAELAAAHRRVAAKGEQYSQAQVRHDQAVVDLAAAQATYRATTDGLAKSLRELEIAVLNGAEPKHIRALQRLHVQGELDAASEYRERATRWGATVGDGPLFACPLGDNREFTAWALHLELLGTYRHSVDQPTPQLAVRLLRPDQARDTGVRRTKLNVPATLRAGELTLDAVLGAATRVDAEDRKLRAWLGDHYGPVVAALTARSSE